MSTQNSENYIQKKGLLRALKMKYYDQLQNQSEDGVRKRKKTIKKFEEVSTLISSNVENSLIDQSNKIFKRLKRRKIGRMSVAHSQSKFIF